MRSVIGKIPAKHDKCFAGNSFVALRVSVLLGALDRCVSLRFAVFRCVLRCPSFERAILLRSPGSPLVGGRSCLRPILSNVPHGRSRAGR